MDAWVNKSQPTFLQIPNNSKLVSFGNCFRGVDDNSWWISCYFLKPDNVIAVKSLAIEALPALAIGRIYTKGEINIANMDMTYISLPPIAAWEMLTMKSVPVAVFSPPEKMECQNQYVFKIPYGDKILWIPVIELARLLFLKTAENSRYAFYEPNLYSMASLDTQQGTAIIGLNKSYPRKLLESRSHQEYLSWLLLNPLVTKSFCSIYKCKQEQAESHSKYTRWVFNFEPTELGNVKLTCYVKLHQAHCFVYEIRSIARLPTTTSYNKIIIKHPEDIKYYKNKDASQGLIASSNVRTEFYVNPEIDDREPPSVYSKHRVMEIPKGRLYFDAFLETERHFKEVTAEHTIGKSVSNSKKDGSVNVGITEGDSKTKVRKTDFQALSDPIDLPADYFTHIRSALQLIKRNKGWTVSETTGVLTYKKNKPFLSVVGAKRRYFYGEITMNGGGIINVLELDLTDKHGLTTLVLRLPPDQETDPVDLILQSLIEKSGHWNKNLINELSDMCAYIAHPKELSDGTDKKVYENWSNRIIREL